MTTNIWITLTVTRKMQLAKGVVGFELCSPDGIDLPPFTPGAHVTVRTPSGLERKYSLANNPDQRKFYLLGVKREDKGSGGSSSFIDWIMEGTSVEISAPRNNFPLKLNKGGYILIAGGIGITPIISMAQHLISSGVKNFHLYYCTRDVASTPFLDILSGPEFYGNVTIHHDGGDLNNSLDFWPLLKQSKGQHIYCCGPRGLMNSVRDMTGHWPTSALNFEAFSEIGTRKLDDHSFIVKLRPTGETIEVPSGISILDAVRSVGYKLASSCENGTCGTCRTELVEGVADHRDLVLTDYEREHYIMICVSRAKTPELFLDLRGNL